MTEAATILSERQGRIGIITLNRPQVLNALDLPTLEQLEQTFQRLEADADISVIVLTGAGERAFVAGGDIGDLESRQGLAHYLEFADVIHRCFRRIEDCDKPTIAAINGWALGGGTELLLATDVRIVSETARFGLPEISIGLFPGAGGTQRLLRQIAPCRARELVFTGDQFSAEEALAWGLVNRIVAADVLHASTLDVASKIASKSPLVLKMLKRTLRHGTEMPLGASLAFEQAMVSLVLDAEDAHEGCRAFLEKRQPNFQGR